MTKQIKQKISETAVGSPAPLVVYAGSAEEALIAPYRRVTIASNIVGANYLPSNSLYSDDIDPEQFVIINQDDQTQNEEQDNPEDVEIKKAPTLMDVELVSNIISYDASGNPYATVTFKVRNSSGLPVKSINARVKII